MSKNIINSHGKFYKPLEIVMLPTREASHIHLVPIGESEEKDGKLVKLESPKLLFVEEPTEFGYPPQHLYFVSDEEIKEGDWYMNTWGDGKPEYMKCNSKKEENELRTIHSCYTTCKKITTTTDLELNLPRPSVAFLRVYCEKNGFK